LPELETFEQVQAALLLANGEPLPVDLAFALAGQGIILDEFIRNYIA
jgi:hypothetical protein